MIQSLYIFLVRYLRKIKKFTGVSSSISSLNRLGLLPGYNLRRAETIVRKRLHMGMGYINIFVNKAY